MGIAKITRNYQVTIPKDVRELRNLSEGDSIIFAIEGDRINIVKLTKDLIKSTAGMWKKSKETGVEYEKKIRASWKKRLKREVE